MNCRPILFLVLLLLVVGCADILEAEVEDEQVELLAPSNGVSTSTQLQAFWWKELDEIVDGYNLQIVTPSFDSIEALITDIDITDDRVFETTLLPGKYQWTVLAFNSTSETEPVIYDLEITSDSANDISNQLIVLVSPEDNMVTNENNIDFLWQQLSGVNNYKIQIASPSFANSTFIIEESTTQDDIYTTTLAEGEYKWRVRGENDVNVTPFSTRSFTIDNTAPTTPTLTSPADRDTIDLPVTLSWNRDNTALTDSVYVYSDSLATDLVLLQGTTGTSIDFNISGNQQYFWQVRSVDEAGNISPLSGLRRFVIR